ncbi:hypothetical protein GALL_441340 [mine drainage metagenome]|uniref:Uncharacterized protein n=1 Tax=mine drainage metagenome TaxID=410659 RepID=A0A1J5Q2W5_9ZZZZ
MDRRWHQFRRFRAGIAEHDALIASAVTVHALRDMGRLLVQIVMHLQRFPMKLLLLVADVFDAIAHDTVHAVHEGVEFLGVAEAHLTADHNAAGGGKGLTRDARIRLFGQKGIKDSVRDTVTDFVGVTLRDGLGRERVILA